MKHHLTMTNLTGTEVTVQAKCPFCPSYLELTVNRAAFDAWEAGTMAQDAFPNLSVDERDALIHGVCSKCLGEL